MQRLLQLEPLRPVVGRPGYSSGGPAIMNRSKSQTESSPKTSLRDGRENSGNLGSQALDGVHGTVVLFLGSWTSMKKFIGFANSFQWQKAFGQIKTLINHQSGLGQASILRPFLAIQAIFGHFQL